MPDVAAERTVTPVWIDPQWLSWLSVNETGHDIRNDTASSRLYEIHQHACDRLAGEPNDFGRGEAIIALRRIVDRRVQALKKIYQLRELPTGVKPKHDLELLESFGIIRPFMLKRLIDIRNLVEHEDARPPSTEECLMFADLVWYFLRSTDAMAKSTMEDLGFGHPDWGMGGGHGREFIPEILLRFRGPASEPPEIEAWAWIELFANEPRTEWIRIEATELEEYEVLAYKGDEEKDEDWLPFMKVVGKVNGTDEQMRSIYRLYFKPNHFW